MTIALEQTILIKLRQLPEAQQQTVLHFVEFLEVKASSSIDSQQTRLASAAQALLADYEDNEELTAFTVLDSEDFYA